MKKFALCLAVAAAMMMVPFSAFGLQMMNNNSMDQITGQAGVSIAFDDVQIFMNVDRFTYIDPDGLTSIGAWGSGGAVVLGQGAAFNVNEFQMDTLKANAILNITSGDATDGAYTTRTYTLTGVDVKTKLNSANSIPLQYDYASGAGFIAQTSVNFQSKGMNHVFGSTYSSYMPQAISIDVTDAAPILSQGAAYQLAAIEGWMDNTASTVLVAEGTKIAAVVITLPTAEFYIDNINIGSMTLSDNVVVNDGTGSDLVNTSASRSFNNNASFGSMEIQGVTFSILNGWIEIAPHD